MEIEKKIFGLRERLGYDFFFLEERWKKMNNVLLGFISPNFSSLSLKKILMVALLFLFFFFFASIVSTIHSSSYSHTSFIIFFLIA
jgi:hypothetical protein